MKTKIVTIAIIIFSIICGIVSHDYIIGSIILMSGLINAYYSSKGMLANYLFGAIYCLLSGYVCIKNGLYGIAVLSFIVYFPFQIHGYLTWKNKVNEDNIVKVRGFNYKNSIIIKLTQFLADCPEYIQVTDARCRHELVCL